MNRPRQINARGQPCFQDRAARQSEAGLFHRRRYRAGVVFGRRFGGGGVDAGGVGKLALGLGFDLYGHGGAGAGLKVAKPTHGDGRFGATALGGFDRQQGGVTGGRGDVGQGYAGGGVCAVVFYREGVGQGCALAHRLGGGLLAEGEVGGFGGEKEAVAEEDIIFVIGIPGNEIGSVGAKRHVAPIRGDGRRETYITVFATRRSLCPIRGNADTGGLFGQTVVNEDVGFVIGIPCYSSY